MVSSAEMLPRSEESEPTMVSSAEMLPRSEESEPTMVSSADLLPRSEESELTMVSRRRVWSIADVRDSSGSSFFVALHAPSRVDGN